MKYRNLLIILVLFFKTISYSQNSHNTTGNNSFLPNLTPPSPQSYQFTEFGKNSINEFSGKINISIPIYNYSAGNLNLPISLNYSGAGVKVNDISSNTGINWTLTTGGVINRIVNDGPDEVLFPTSRKYINYNSLITDASENCRPFSQYYIELARNNEVYDTEIDIWAFNFSGYSGKFYLDEDFNPVYIENENEIKIEIIGTGTTNAEKIRNNNSFLITTPDGVKYYFGGNACEATNVFSGHRGISQVANTSFYLYKIQHPVSGEIIFEYQNEKTALLNYGKSYKLSSQCGPITAYSIPFYQVINSINQISNPIFIKKIKNTLTSEEVNFNYDFYNNNRDYLASLKNIEIKSNNTLLKKVNFTYLFPMNIESAWQTPFLPASRFFLQKLELLNGGSTDLSKNEVYKFDYDDPYHMPKRLSPKQDLLGYFNNKNNETTIPKPAYFGNVSNTSFGDLNPDFNFSIKGSLTKITYPTGGFSLFEYEPMPAKKEIYKTYTSDFGGFTVPGYNSYDDYIDFLPVFKTQTVPITFYLASENPEVNHFCQASLKVTDLTDLNTTPSIFSKSLGYNPTPRSYDFTFLQGHRYKIEIIPNTNQYCDIEANFSVTLFDGYKPIDGFGVRLKSQRDFPNNDGSFSNYKRYYYKNSNAINDNLYNLNLISFNPKYSLIPNRSDACFEGYGIDIYSEAADIYGNRNSFETFDVVTTSFGGDNFENGGSEKYFYKQINENNNKIIVTNDGCWAAPYGGIMCGPPREISTGITMVRNASTTNEVTDLSSFNGKLLLERNFIKKNNEIFKDKETIYSYNLERKHLNNATSFIGRSLFDINTPLNFCPNNPNVPISALSDFFMAYYFIETFSYKLNSIYTKNYIDPVPLNQNVVYFSGAEQDFTENYELHDINFKKITSTQTFEYGALKGLPTKVITDTSKGDFNSTVNTYVNQASTLTGLSEPQTTAFNNLLASNRVASPIEVKQFRNTEMLSKQRTVFKLDSYNHVLPESIQTAKGTNPLEVRAIFEEYDQRGNPTLVLLKDGTKTKYFYNSNNQVVAKIENFTGNATSIPSDPCQMITNFSNSLVTLYTYDTTTQLLTQITDTNCRKTTYVYDELLRLKQIIDHDGNVIKEFDNNYRPN